MSNRRHYPYIIVGSGAGGATLARELSRQRREVLVLERGQLEPSLGTYEDAVRYYDAHKLTQIPLRSREGIILWRALMAGGSTMVSCGNGVRSLEAALAARGLDLSKEFAAVEAELAIAPTPEEMLSAGTHRLRQAAQALGVRMERMPKFFKKGGQCTHCGRCVLGCRYAARWTALDYLEEAQAHGARVEYGVTVESIRHEQGQVRGVYAHGPQGDVSYRAGVVILAAGGLGTPIILQNSGLDAGQGLFIDTFVNVYGVHPEGLNQVEEPLMALVVMQFHEEHGFLLSPYISLPRRVRLIEAGPAGYALPTRKILGLMVKTMDDASGRVYADGSVSKGVTDADQARLDHGARIAREILLEAGVKPGSIVQTRPAGAHPGGTAAIGRVVDISLQTEIAGLYVCDASALPETPGVPPIVTILALAKYLGSRL